MTHKKWDDDNGYLTLFKIFFLLFVVILLRIMSLDFSSGNHNLTNIFSSITRFADKQIVRVQETPDEIPEGGTPHTVSLLMHDKLVDTAKPGDRVEVRL